MRLWTIQSKEVYEILHRDGVYHCDRRKSEGMRNFVLPYLWLSAEMKRRVGPPPQGVTLPIWAWHTWEWKHKKPDLRAGEFYHYPPGSVCMEIEIPDEKVLLNDGDAWDIILNNGVLFSCADEEEYNRKEEALEKLPKREQRQIKRQSWDKVFDITPSYKEWDRRGMYVQATFWELRREQVVKVWQMKH